MTRFPPKRILVGVDLSQPSLAAWRLAEEWARRFKAKIQAVHAQAPGPLDIPTAPKIPGGSAAAAQDLLEEFRGRTGAGLKLETGDPVVTLLRLVRTFRADLLVVGTHGRAGMPRLLLGSVAEALIRECPVPVLAVPEYDRPIRSILAPVNFMPYSKDALLYAAAVGANLGAEVSAHHVAVAGQSVPVLQEKLTKLVRELPPGVAKAVDSRPTVTTGTPAEAIAELARSSDLVVLSGHRKGLIQDLVMGSTAQRVIRGAKTPLLSVPVRASSRFAVVKIY